MTTPVYILFLLCISIRRGVVSGDGRDELPPSFAQALAAQSLSAQPLSAQPLSAQALSAPPHSPAAAARALQPFTNHSHGSMSGSYTNLFEVSENARHAYMNCSLDLDPVPLQD
ncbi:uncharacterized protein LOC119831372 [Zerene cesonia]|uniref:uncharacterized protein LOC119831372 n=1 Tax=Zerene cesonia TaxID=33412 RepID=UPI0018E54DD9|nr:uncharacterized protein LOC119831372 [Zerene cesonia]